MRQIMRGRARWWLFAGGALVLVGGLIAAFVATTPREDPPRTTDLGAGPVHSAPPAADGDWTRPPAEIYTVRGELIAASENRWMIRTGDQNGFSFSIKDAAGRTVGDDFRAQRGACARTRSGVLGCQIGATFSIIDLETGHRDVRAVEDTLGQLVEPMPLADGWVIGVNGARRVISETGEVRWRFPADQQMLAPEPRGPVFSRGDQMVTTDSRFVHSAVRNATTGAVIAECDCTVTLLSDGFASQPAETLNGPTTLYSLDGRKVATYPPDVRVVPGGTRTVITEPAGQTDDGRPTQRIRTVDGRILWEGSGTPATYPTVCGDWLIRPDRVISIVDGTPFTPPGLNAGVGECLAAGADWVMTSAQVIRPRSGAWGPAVGSLQYADGRLANRVDQVTALYSPSAPRVGAVPVTTAAPDFSVTLPFTFGRTRWPIEQMQWIKINRVSYQPDTGRWLVGADGITQLARSQFIDPAVETFVIAADGRVVDTLPTGRAALKSCGPYSVRLDVDDPSRVVVQRNDGVAVRIGPQPDPEHRVAQGVECVGYSDDFLALARDNVPGLTLLPLRPGVEAQRLPYATGFTQGRPFAVDSRTITVFPAVRE
ncbi:hypothetical protein [Gordonia phthalatica]|uniref:hypothetical protein n=1 Tax=Gordonia phthalatica TaxID=1136941 RepID=UPI0012FED3E9|nr:hypothetical protein [Gordonia phthalatica]